MITLEQLKAATGISDTTILKGLNDTLDKYQINTPLRECHFLAQVLHESGNLKLTKENLNYGATGLVSTFKKYFINEAAATSYARNPEKIANKVYANRMGNGNEVSGDGWKFRGRGYIQLTGKDNYKALSDAIGIDFISHPELLESAEYAALSAGWFWNKANLNSLADNDDVVGITKKINGGINGLDDRKLKLNILKTIIK